MIIRTNVKAGGLNTYNHNEKIAKSFVIKTGVKAGGLDTQNHNEKMTSDSDIDTIEQKKTLGKKLRLSKETVRALTDSDLQKAIGGVRASGVSQMTSTNGETGGEGCAGC
jgi:hypothetical protein